MSTSKTSKANNSCGPGCKSQHSRATSSIAAHRRAIDFIPSILPIHVNTLHSTPAQALTSVHNPRNPRKQLFLLLILISTAASSTGCNRRTPQMKHFAEKFLGNTAASYKKITALKTRISACKTNCEQPGDIEQNPAFALLVDSKDAIDMYGTRSREYLVALKGEKQKPADEQAEAKLQAVRDAFALCALRVTIDLKDKLPAYSVWEGAPPETIIAKSRESLGLKPGPDPPPGSCAKYEKLSAETYKLLKLAPASN